ncbi:putative flavin-containing monooxygenase 1 [Nymphaea thermarum]|nr:putative flavin-containing monooxygenase 1 [Nymphaea thermarum]
MARMEGKKIAIVGAGISGLIACKYLKTKGFDPIVFEMKDNVGGVWLRTLDSTLLQTPKLAFQFSDFPWPASVTNSRPTHGEVLEYIQSYAKHFQLLQYIEFNSKVVGMDFVKNSESQENGVISCNGTAWSGEAFGSSGSWHITVHNAQQRCTKVHIVDFVIVCTGRYGDIPKMPTFEAGKGPEVFKGKVVHAMELYSMDHNQVDDLISGKKTVVVGFQKSAFDIAAKCASINGKEFPCTMICREPKWHCPQTFGWSLALAFLYGTRFSELLDHKPGESLIHGILATLLSPLRWGVSKMVEICLQWQLPMKKYDMLPKENLFHQIASCHFLSLPENFYGCLEEGSIVIKKSSGWGFCEHGLTLGSNEDAKLEADLVILATGYESNQKLKDLFDSPLHQQLLSGFESGIVPLYRECIQPQIPEMAIIGYTEGVSNLFTSEMEIRWLVCFLSGGFRLPSSEEMEEDMKKWDDYKRKHSGYKYKKSSIAAIHIWYNDMLCKDMGCIPKRKKNWLSELFLPYGPADYSNL